MKNKKLLLLFSLVALVGCSTTQTSNSNWWQTNKSTATAGTSHPYVVAPDHVYPQHTDIIHPDVNILNQDKMNSAEFQRLIDQKAKETPSSDKPIDPSLLLWETM